MGRLALACAVRRGRGPGRLAVDDAACYLHVMYTQRLPWLRRARLVLFSGSLMAVGAVMHAACEGNKGGAHASQKAEDLAEALAKVDDVTITVGEFQERINQQSPYVRARYTSMERKKEFLDNLARSEVLAKEPDRRGLSKDAGVARTRKQGLVRSPPNDERGRPR